MLVIGTLSITAIVVWIIPDITWTLDHTVLMEIDVTLETCLTGIISSALITWTFACLTSGSKVRIGFIWTSLDALIIIEERSNTL